MVVNNVTLGLLGFLSHSWLTSSSGLLWLGLPRVSPCPFGTVEGSHTLQPPPTQQFVWLVPSFSTPSPSQPRAASANGKLSVLALHSELVQAPILARSVSASLLGASGQGLWEGLCKPSTSHRASFLTRSDGSLALHSPALLSDDLRLSAVGSSSVSIPLSFL